MTRRSLTTGAALLVGVLILGVLAFVGYRNLSAPIGSEDDDAPKAGCPAGEREVTKRFIRRGEVKVSVYNAGGVQGAASRTLSALEAAGFQPGEVGNAPDDVKVNVARVFTTEEGDKGAELVARFLGGASIEVTSEEYGPGIDVFVGKDQKPFRKKAPRTLELESPITSCERVEQ